VAARRRPPTIRPAHYGWVLLLLDTNVEVKSDPLSPAVESDYNVANRFLRLAAEGGHRLFVHPSSLLDFARDEDLVRRRLRERTFQRWPRLESPPRLASDRRALLGPGPEYGSNDDVDQDMLAAVVHDPVDRLVTQDAGIHRWARLLGVGDRVLRLPDAVDLLEGLFSPLPVPPPAVQRVKAHELDRADPFFVSSGRSTRRSTRG